jgi:AcrR family transcriptional regulator
MEQPGLRQRQRVQTRRRIQEHAMRLFGRRGYDATTVADVAAAADVSSMTVFRHFPTKEDLVLTDEYDATIIDAIRARPADEPVIQRIGAALIETTANHDAADRAMLLSRLRLGLSVPALRARMWDGQYQAQRLIVEGLRNKSGPSEFELWVASGVCLAAVTAAILHWAEHDGRKDLVALMTEALRLLMVGPHVERRRSHK